VKKRLTPDFELAFDKPEENAGFLLWQTANLWQRKMKEQLDKVGITHVQFLLLNTLASFNLLVDKPITQAMLAEKSGCDKMMTSKVIRLLEERQFVVRKPHHADTRSLTILITKSGMELLQKATPVFMDVDKLFFKPIKDKVNSQNKRFKKIIKKSEKEVETEVKEKEKTKVIPIPPPPFDM